MADERTPGNGPELSPEQQILGILAADDGDNPEPVGDVADETEVAETEVDEPEVDEPETETDEAEDEGDTEELDSDDEEQQQDDENEEEPEPSEFTVKVDGQEITVTLDELKSGYSRQADYTRKSQQLAEQRRAVEQEAAAARAEREHYQRTLQQMQQQLAAQQEQEPDWDRLYAENPTEAPRIERQWRVRKEQQERLVQEQQRVMALQQQEQAEQLRQYVEENRQKLPELIPEWTDPKVATQERTGIRDTLLESGFADEEIAQIYDARVMPLVRDAWLYRQQKAKREALRPAAPKKGPKPAAPRAASSPAESKQKSIRSQRQRLRQTGSVDDAAAILANMI